MTAPAATVATHTLGDVAATFRTLKGAQNLVARNSFADVPGVAMVVLEVVYPEPAYAVFWAYER